MYSIRTLLILGLLISSFSIFAQDEVSDPLAREILEQVADRFDSMEEYRIDFKMTIKIPEMKEQLFEGVFYGSGEKYKLDMLSRQIFCDGTSVWMYDKEYNEAQLYSKNEIEKSESITPDKMLHIFENEDYVYALVFEDVANKVIEFKPKNRESDIVKMRLELDTKYNIQSIKTFFKDASRYELLLGDILSVAEGDEINFSFREIDFPGVYVEDLRME